jgi:regulator of RNase E activity RraA
MTNTWVRNAQLRRLPAVLFLAALVAPCIWGQVFSLSKEQMIEYTAQNPFDRFPDGRPKVPDALLEKLKDMSAEEVLGLNQRGYRNQWEAGWQVLHPQKRLIGRALTLQLMPTRPDVADVDQAARRAKNQMRLGHQTAIDMLQKGDVLVVDACGAQFGGVIGDNLSYYIMKTTGAGFVIDGAIRDIVGITPFTDLVGYYRAAVPPAIHDLMVTGINVPIRIGNATVMPGDVVFGDPEGVYFIPPSELQALVDEADVTHIHDEWTKRKFDEGKYVSSDIYSAPRDPALMKEYQDYLKEKLGAQRYEEYMKRRPAQGQGGRGAPGGRGPQGQGQLPGPPPGR